MSKPTPLSGFPELLPAQRVVEQQVIDTLRHTFELHGFAGIETRAVEPLDQLLRKGDTSKEVYLLRRLHEESAEGHAGIGLHFDLTVPFARYVLENAGKLDFPFRRYQIQKAWRGERPQEGRFREFTQADIDIVGRDSLAFHHDVEVTRVMVDALTRLDFLPGFRLQVNNRKLIQGFYAGLGINADNGDTDEVMRLVDKLDKLPVDKVRDLLLQEAGLSVENADRVLELATIRSDDDGFVDAVRALGVEHELLDEGLAELSALVRGCADLVSDRVRVDGRPLDRPRPRLLHRHRLRDAPRRLRVDGLHLLRRPLRRARQRRPYDVPRRRHLARREPGRRTPARPHRPDRLALGAQRRARRGRRRGLPRRPAAPWPPTCARRDVPCEVAPDAAKFGKQIRYAERRGIPFVWFTRADGTHQVKDIRTGDQVDADPATWTPPEADLRPHASAPRTNEENQ